MMRCSFIEDTYFNELEKIHEQKMGSALQQSVNLVLAPPSYPTHSTQSQIGFSRDTLCEEIIVNAVRFMSKVIASGAHG